MFKLLRKGMQPSPHTIYILHIGTLLIIIYIVEILLFSTCSGILSIQYVTLPYAYVLFAY